MTPEPFYLYTESCKDVVKSSSTKIGKIFKNLLLEIHLLYMVINSRRWSVTVPLQGKAQESAGLLLPRIIHITECRKGDDEGKTGYRIPWVLSRKSWRAHTSQNYFSTDFGAYQVES